VAKRSGVGPAARCPACLGEAVHDQDIAIRGELTGLFRCRTCSLRLFPEPTWMDAVYAEPISALDIGLATRCINHARIVEALVRAEGLQRRAGLDWGGGYGLLTRLLRDRGIDMHHFEPYAQNLFADGFAAEPGRPWGFVSAVEVFEHLADPMIMLGTLPATVPLIVVSTVLVPEGMADLSDWWYIGAPTGQHITFYTVEALQALADRLGYRLTSDRRSVHLLHREPLRATTRLIMKDVRSSVLLARGLRLTKPSASLRDSDGTMLIDRYLALRSVAVRGRPRR
jgi:hypothetical protein